MKRRVRDCNVLSRHRKAKPRGFHVEYYDDRVDGWAWVRDGFRLERCHGEAHGNPFIDNCMICAPLWGWVAVPGRFVPPTCTSHWVFGLLRLPVLASVVDRGGYVDWTPPAIADEGAVCR